MKIIRTINGKNVEIELTRDELVKAKNIEKRIEAKEEAIRLYTEHFAPDYKVPLSDFYRDTFIKMYIELSEEFENEENERLGGELRYAWSEVFYPLIISAESRIFASSINDTAKAEEVRRNVFKENGLYGIRF